MVTATIFLRLLAHQPVLRGPTDAVRRLRQSFQELTSFFTLSRLDGQPVLRAAVSYSEQQMHRSVTALKQTFRHDIHRKRASWQKE
jgi:hypothetical protein